MTSSLVGSEMCIRDSFFIVHNIATVFYLMQDAQKVACKKPCPVSLVPVSYTHLTLPTICSV
eukprot:4889973-Prorocentrum_lima.AAC.1